MKDLKLIGHGLLGIVLCFLSEISLAQALPELIPYKTTTGWGYSDSNKVIKIPCIYRSASLFYYGKGRVTVEQDGELVHCLIDRAGKYLIGPELHWSGEINIDPVGKYLIEPELHWSGALNPYLKLGILNAHDGGGRWGGIDTNGHVVIPFLYDPPPKNFVGHDRENFRFRDENGQHLIALKGGKWGVTDSSGAVRVPFMYDSIETVMRNRHPDSLVGWIVRCGKLKGFYNAAGEMVVPCSFDDIAVPSWVKNLSGFAAQSHGAWGWYNITSKKLVAAQFARPPTGVGNYIQGYDTAQQRAILLSADGILLKDQSMEFEEYDDRNLPIPRVDQVLFDPYNVTRTFSKDGRDWQLTYVVRPQLNSKPRYNGKYIAAKSISGGEPTAFAVVDSNFNFIVAPQSELEIVGGDIDRGYLIVRKTGEMPGYGVTDLKFLWLVHPQPYYIGVYFQWKKKQYLIAARQAGPPYRADRYMEKDHELFVLRDASGHIPRGFENKYYPRFFDYRNRSFSAVLTQPVTDIIAAREEYIRLNGKPAFPKLQARYANLDVISPQLAQGQDRKSGQYSVFDLDGKPLLPPSYRIIPSNSRTGDRIFQYPFPYPDYLNDQLLPVWRKSGADTAPFKTLFYIDHHGTVYADAEVVR